jgi:hypothetical protein
MAVHGIAERNMIEMTKDEGMTKREKSTSLRVVRPIQHSRSFWGAHAPSRADFAALVEISLQQVGIAGGEVCDHEGVIARTRGACAPI